MEGWKLIFPHCNLQRLFKGLTAFWDGREEFQKCIVHWVEWKHLSSGYQIHRKNVSTYNSWQQTSKINKQTKKTNRREIILPALWRVYKMSSVPQMSGLNIWITLFLKAPVSRSVHYSFGPFLWLSTLMIRKTCPH